MSKKRRAARKRTNKTTKQGAVVEHSSKAFLTLVEEASLFKVKPFVAEEVQKLGFGLQQGQAQTTSALVNRLIVLEKLLVEKLDVTMEELGDRVAGLEDEQSGYELIEGELESGDLARIKISTKAADQEEFQGESNLAITGCGEEPFTIGPELEPQLIGMQVGDIKELPFGKDGQMTAKVEMQRVSRKIVEKTLEGETDESQNVG